MKKLFSEKARRVSENAVTVIAVGALLSIVWHFATADEVSVAELGGAGSVKVQNQDAFSLPAKNASRAHRRSFVVGNALFKENWVSTPSSVKSRQGLGPIFNAQSCSTCHFKDGRGQPPTNSTESFSSMLIRWSIPGEDEHGGPKPIPNYGDQLNHRAIVGVRAEGDAKVRFEEIHGKYPDGTEFTLHKPIYTFENLAFGALPENVMVSPRVAPQVIGLGLLEAIDERTLLSFADPHDQNGDGVTGRANWVWDIAQKKKRIGRFGWKANQPSLAQQNAGAFLGDMGITTKHFPLQNCASQADDCLKAPSTKHSEADEKDMRHMNTYTKLLAVPVRRDVNHPQVRAGEKLFRMAKCQSCHIEQMRTGVDPEFPENSNQTIRPFTDLLLHDMGESLADNRPDFEATATEWRTPPLWGIGLFKTVNGHTRYLHDGRARNLEEAVLWHGGEAETSKQIFMSMSKDDRISLIKFLESL